MSGYRDPELGTLRNENTRLSAQIEELRGQLEDVRAAYAQAVEGQRTARELLADATRPPEVRYHTPWRWQLLESDWGLVLILLAATYIGLVLAFTLEKTFTQEERIQHGQKP